MVFPPRGRATSLQSVWFFTLTGLLAVWASVAWDYWNSEERALAQLRRETAVLAQLFANHAEATFRDVDHALIFLREQWPGGRAQFEEHGIRHLAWLRGTIRNFLVTDRDGALQFSQQPLANRPSLADLDVFKEVTGMAATGGADVLFIGRPVRGQLAEGWSIPITRPIYRDGQFAGIIVAAVDPAQLVGFYGDTGYGDEGAARMIRDTGEVMARSFDADKYIGNVLKPTPYGDPGAPVTGSFRRRAQVDGVDRLSSYHRLPDRGVSVVVGPSVDKALEPTRRHQRIVIVAASLISILLLLLAWNLRRNILRAEADRAQLQENSERLFLATSSNGIGVWDLAPREGTLIWDDSMFALYGQRREEFSGSYEAWRSSLHPDDREQGEQAVATSLRDGTPFDAEFRIVKPGGEIRHIRSVAKLFRDADGAVVRMLGVNRDVTREHELEAYLRESRERLGLVLASSGVATWDLLLPAGSLSFDARWRAMLGSPPEETRASLTEWQQGVHADDLPTLQSTLDEHLADKTANFRAEFRVRNAHGDWVWMAMVGRVTARDSAGGATRVMGIAFDITDRKVNEEALLEAKRAAEFANRAKDAFLANMSHEIRNPLNVVLGLARVLEGDMAAGERRDIAQRIAGAGAMLMRTLNDILDFSKIEAGELAIDKQPFQLQAVLANVASLMQALAQAKGLQLRLDCDDCGVLTLVGDAMRVEQVLINLVGNAIKFTPIGDVVLAVRVQERAGPTLVVHFEVRDSGIGIPADRLTSLFRPFVQGDSGTARRYGGTGLGLSICKRLISLMGGEIGVASTEGVGSQFWFTLPFDVVADVLSSPSRSALPSPLTPTSPSASALTSPSPPHEPTRPATSGQRLAGLCILVVDDSNMNVDVFRRILERQGASVVAASDGLEAIQLLGERPGDFAAVLMDTQMPGLDGLAATRMIRTELGLTQLPVITCSGGAYAEDRANSRAAGANDFVVKPVDIEQLVGTILRWARPGTG